MPDKTASNVDKWIEQRDAHKIRALEKASKIFDKKDSMTVNTLEAIYGKESSFGNFKMGTRGSAKPAGHFQQKKDSATEHKLKVEPNNDERFDIDQSSIGAAKQLKNLDNLFSNKANLGSNLYTIPVSDIDERKKFVIAAYNIGQGRMAGAQNLAQKDGKDPTKLDNVKQYLEKAGAKEFQVKEVLDYVEIVSKYEKEFVEKSQANKTLKHKNLTKESAQPEDGHWITEKGRHILIAN